MSNITQAVKSAVRLTTALNNCTIQTIPIIMLTKLIFWKSID
jgi:hypothetical protein